MRRAAGTGLPGHMAAGYQEWRQLLFLHWPVPAEPLRRLVPARLTLDRYQGQAYVGLVPFVVQAARPWRRPARPTLSFLETNVRTYVHLDGQDPGVFFFSLDAGSALAVAGARLTYGLPYFHAGGSLRRAAGTVEYALRRRRPGRPGIEVRYEVGPTLGAATPGSLEHFLIERYRLHVQRGPTLWTVPVDHTPYPLQQTRLLSLRQDLTEAAGLPSPRETPLAHYAAGVDVAIGWPRIRPAG